MDLALLDNRLVVALLSTGLGAFLMFFIQMIVNKRGLFTYVVRHNKVGMSTDDAVFGSVRVTWNNSLIRRAGDVEHPRGLRAHAGDEPDGSGSDEPGVLARDGRSQVPCG